MALHFGQFASAGIVALYEEAPGGGDFRDIDAPRNRPARDPANWLANIYFHSDLDNLEVESDTTVTINHAPVAAGSGPGGSVTVNGTVQYGGATATHLLISHGLGYKPHVLVLVGDNVLFAGTPIQTDADKRMRSVSPYVTTSEVRLHEWTVRTSNVLGAVSKDYRVIVFRQPPAPSGNKLRDFQPGAGIFQLAFGRFDVDRRYLQVVPGGTPWGLSSGRSIDLKRGGVRLVNPDGSIWDTVPTTFFARISPPGNGGGVLYYDGSFAGSSPILVQAP